MALPRIAPDALERLKKDVSIQWLAEKRGIKLKPQGKDLVGLCPNTVHLMIRMARSISSHVVLPLVRGRSG
jgi:hypothetical protein